jgi:hypothetical protein
MCGLPSRDLGTQSLLYGPAGYTLNKTFGKKTTQRIADKLDKVHMSTVGKVIPHDIIKSHGFLPENNPTNLVDPVDLKQQRKDKRRRSEAIERGNTLRALGQTRRQQSTSILGG